MRRFGIAICLMVVGLGGTAIAEDDAPDPPDETETVCPHDYHPIEGIEGSCAQDDGTEDSDGDCPGNWTPGGGGDVGDYWCICLGTTDPNGGCDTGGWQPPECPTGWHNADGIGVCQPDSPHIPGCPPLCSNFDPYGTNIGCHCPPPKYAAPKVVVLDYDDVSVFTTSDASLEVHYNIDGGLCPIGQAYDHDKYKCRPVCESLADVPCFSYDAAYLYLSW